MGITTSSNSAITYEFIDKTTLVSTTATVNFYNIPQTYSDLIIIGSTQRQMGGIGNIYIKIGRAHV